MRPKCGQTPFGIVVPRCVQGQSFIWISHLGDAIQRAATPDLPQNLHGKEGVDGSSPSEGFTKAPHCGYFCCRMWRRT